MSQRVSTKVAFSLIYVKFRVFGTRTSLMPSTAASQRQRDLEKKNSFVKTGFKFQTMGF